MPQIKGVEAKAAYKRTPQEAKAVGRQSRGRLQHLGHRHFVALVAGASRLLMAFQR